MAIRTQQSISGFIATDPKLSQTDRGEARFYARFGQENYRREEDGSFTQLETTFHNLVIYRATAERAFERFAKNDRFVAEGYQHDYSYDRDGQKVEGEEFVVKKIGHDTARTRYEVDRTPRTPEQTVEGEATAREQSRAFDAPPPRPSNDTPGLGR